MIIVCIKNGLGNQMFQYAFGKVLEWQYNTSVFFDIMNDDFVSGEQTDMEIFTIGKYTVVEKEKTEKFKPFSVKQFLLNKQYIKYIYFKIRRYFHPAKLVTEPLPSQYIQLFDHLNLQCDYYFMGHWMNLRYFEGYDVEIKQLFQLKVTDFYQTELAQEIANSERDTVSLHIRRGDYLISGFMNNTEMSYYEKAVDYVKINLQNPFIYIFTNDPSWVKQELKLKIPFKVIGGNTANDGYKDMLLMSLCRNNIIANSSFSWWGAYLNKNENPIIITPRKWFADEERNKYAHEMLPESWIKF